MNSLISVIIPIYNMEQFVKTCVDSVMSQTYKNLEIILVNDGSIDGSKVVCEEIEKNNPNILLINQKNQGVSVARNVGISLAHGEYLLFLDADDTLPQNAIQLLYEKAIEFDSDMTIGKIYETENIPIEVFEKEEFLIKVLEDSPLGYYACRILYKREFVKDITFPKGFVCAEDSYFVFQCALKNPKVVTINKQVYIYYSNPNSTTHSPFTSKKYGDICELLYKKESIISNNHPHLMPLFYHFKTKIQMTLLQQLCYTKGAEFRKKEKESLARFNEVKEYFKSELPHSNTEFYNILYKNLYYPYKICANFRRTIKKCLKK